MPDDELANVNLRESSSNLVKKSTPSSLSRVRQASKQTYIFNSGDLDRLDASQALREQTAREASLSERSEGCVHRSMQRPRFFPLSFPRKTKSIQGYELPRPESDAEDPVLGGVHVHKPSSNHLHIRTYGFSCVGFHI